MDNLVIFGLIVFSIIRAFGFLISLDLYLDLRNNRYLFLMSGWISWFFAGLFPIFAHLTSDQFLSELFMLLNGMSVTLGAFLIVFSITGIFKTYPPKSVGIIITLLVIIPILFHLSGGNKLVGIISALFLFLSYFVVMILNTLVGKEFRLKVGNSYKWIILLRVVVTLQVLILSFTIFTGELYGLYDSTDVLLIILNYGMGTVLTLVFVILIIHFEHSAIVYQKNFLKDTLTHDIANILQIISSATEMLSVEQKSQEKSDLILKKSNEASKLINEIKDL